MKRTISIAVVLLLCGCAGLGNFGYVGDGVYRSAQRWYSFKQWEAINPKTVINLATDAENDWQDQYEREWAYRQGIILWEFDNLGPEYNFNRAYYLLKQSEKPVIVHCEGGRDRTGGLIAVYKRDVLKRTYSDIIDDWQIYGMPAEHWLHFLFRRLR